MSRSLIARLWGSVVEPRTVTVLTVIAYTLTAILGYSLLIVPPTEHDHDVWLRLFAALFLTGGGVTGIPSAWAGAWWLERASAFSSSAGMLVTLTEVLAVSQDMALAVPRIVVISLLLCALFWASRFFRVIQAPFAPGKGPLSPEQRAAVEAALAADQAAKNFYG